ncbi:MAG: Matrixin [Chthonomonadales bacterium]
MRKYMDLMIVMVTALAGWMATSAIQEPVTKKAEFTYEDFRIVPVRVHLLRAPDGHDAGTHLKLTDVERIFRKANAIWHAAGIHLWVESIVDEPAEVDAMAKSQKSANPEVLLPIRPKASLAPGMFHVYYIWDMPPNGIFMQRDGIFVKELAKLRKVEGGIDEPLPRVTAHELGHGLGLAHRQDTFNLLASGTTGTSLNATEIEKARSAMWEKRWILPVADFAKETDALQKSKPDQSKSRWKALADIPGASKIKEDAVKALGPAGTPAKP